MSPAGHRCALGLDADRRRREGVGFVDIEQGWFPAFDAASARSGTRISRVLRPAARIARGPANPEFAGCPQSHHHGTAVVGVLAGVDNTTGIVGATPSLPLGGSGVAHQPGHPGDVANATIDSAVDWWLAVRCSWDSRPTPIPGGDRERDVDGSQRSNRQGRDGHGARRQFEHQPR